MTVLFVLLRFVVHPALGFRVGGGFLFLVILMMFFLISRYRWLLVCAYSLCDQPRAGFQDGGGVNGLGALHAAARDGDARLVS